MEKKILINASNLHVGGGVQVASSFIYEISRIGRFKNDIHVLVSSKVDRELRTSNADFSVFSSYIVKDLKGPSVKSLFSRQLSRKFDLIFTVFGPDYRFSLAGSRNVVGFAQPWIIYPENPIYDCLNLINKIKTKLKFGVQKFFFSRSDVLIVELPHVRERIVSSGIKAEESVTVVHNSVSSIYSNPSLWSPLEIAKDPVHFNIGFVGRDYPHKNLNILPEVKEILKNVHGFNVDFFVTLTAEEISRKSKKFRDSVYSIGELSVSQCPSFYAEMDAIVFPSLLECFSATPLEAMVMERPLFSSDRKFVKDVCGDYAYYFDPLDAESIASTISDYLLNRKGKDSNNIHAAKAHALSFSSAESRARKYLSIIEVELEQL